MKISLQTLMISKFLILDAPQKLDIWEVLVKV